MARPVKNNADYFSHDGDMRNDPKIKALRRKYGFMGYALWCYLLEVLTDSDFFVYEWNDLNIELLAGDFDCEPSELRDVVNYCIQLGLLTLSDDGKLSCLRLIERFDALLSKRERDRGRVFADENPQSKVKDSKGKKKKGERREIFNVTIEDFSNNFPDEPFTPEGKEHYKISKAAVSLYKVFCDYLGKAPFRDIPSKEWIDKFQLIKADDYEKIPSTFETAAKGRTFTFKQIQSIDDLISKWVRLRLEAIDYWETKTKNQ